MSEDPFGHARRDNDLTFETISLRLALEQDLKQIDKEKDQPAEIRSRANELRDQPGRKKEAAHLALLAYFKALEVGNIRTYAIGDYRHTAISIWGEFAWQLVQAGRDLLAVNTCRYLVERQGLANSVIHRVLAEACYNLDFPDRAISEINIALDDGPDYDWFLITAAKCHFLQSLQEMHINTDRSAARDAQYEAARHLGLAYQTGHQELRDDASWYFEQLVQSDIAIDNKLYGEIEKTLFRRREKLGELGESTRLDTAQFKDLRANLPPAEDVKRPMQRHITGLRKNHREMNALPPPTYQAVVHALTGRVSE